MKELGLIFDPCFKLRLCLHNRRPLYFLNCCFRSAECENYLLENIDHESIRMGETYKNSQFYFFI